MEVVTSKGNALQFLLEKLGYEKVDNEDVDLWRKVTDDGTDFVHECDPDYDWVASIPFDDIPPKYTVRGSDLYFMLLSNILEDKNPGMDWADALETEKAPTIHNASLEDRISAHAEARGF